MASRKERNRSKKKVHLERAKRQTKWAPLWAVLRKFGKGKRIHPSAITHIRRHWRRDSLKIKPRIMKKKNLG